MSEENFNFYVSSAVVFSSMIEGNNIDFDSYLKYTTSGMNMVGKAFLEIEDLRVFIAWLWMTYIINHFLTTPNPSLGRRGVLSPPFQGGARGGFNVYFVRHQKIIYWNSAFFGEMIGFFKRVFIIWLSSI